MSEKLEKIKKIALKYISEKNELTHMGYRIVGILILNGYLNPEKENSVARLKACSEFLDMPMPKTPPRYLKDPYDNKDEVAEKRFRSQLEKLENHFLEIGIPVEIDYP